VTEPFGAGAYASLEQRFRRLGALREAAGVLHWDMAAVMPVGGAEARSEQLAALDVVCHDLLVEPETADLLDAADRDRAGLAPWQAANLREMRRQWRHATALDGALVDALAKARHRCEMAWRAARPAGDFALVLPALETLLALIRETAMAKADVLGCEPYEALLDEHEPGCRRARIDALFEPLAELLPGLVERVLERQAGLPAPLRPEGPFPRERQEALARRLMAALGFDFERGRLDQSLHPFCGGVPDDVRITTRYDEADFMTALMGVLHETGHALYERGLPKDWRLQPVGAARGMALHESQSLLIEMQVCRGRAFLGFAAPMMREAFGGSGPAWDPDNLARTAQRVARGFIRVDADEVTYPAHVILRYRLETAMLSGALRVADLPGAWNELHRSLLGLVPPDDRRGCLQDIHWYDGAWGYFPTYTLGAMAAAQLFQAALSDRPEIPHAVAGGDFSPLSGWLGAQVHGLGSSLATDEILERATGRPLGLEAFRAHLEQRYLG